MSTKTLRKRIALVAVSAMGFGLLSSVAANATTYVASIAFKSAAAGDSTVGVCSTGNGSTVALARSVAVGGKVTISADSLATDGYFTVSGPATMSPTTGTTGGSDGVSATASGVSAGTAQVVVNVTGTGLVTVNAYDSSTDTGANSTLYINGVSACTSGVSVAKSYAQVVASSTKILTLTQWTAGTASSSGTTNAAGAMNTSNDEQTTFANAATAYIGINFNDAYGASVTTSKTLVVSCTNNAVVGGSKGGYYTVADTAGYKQVSVAQGTSNAPLSTTCTISSDATVLATKSISFLGQLASIVLSQSASGNYDSSTSGNIKYYLKDSAGNNLPEASSPTLTASTASKVTNALSALATPVPAYGALATGSQTSYGKLKFNCLDYGDTSISIYALDSSGNTITSNVVPVHCGGAFYNFTATLDKSSYKTGDIATLTIVGKDYNKGLVGSDVTLGTGLAVAMAGMTPVVAPATTDTATDANGTWTYQYQVGTSTGNFTGTAKVVVPSTSTQYNQAITMQYSIADSTAGVSNADVLAAIVKLIASINKQIAALQKALMKK